MSIELEYIVGPIYADIPDFPHYRVGIDGSLYTRYLRTRYGKGLGQGSKLELSNNWHQMTPRLDKKNSNYFCFRVSINNGENSTNFSVHTLVLTAFVGPCPIGLECRHLDGNPLNNKLENLCWGTHLENEQDKIKHGTLPKGESHYRAKLTNIEVEEIRQRYYLGEKQKDLAIEFDVSRATICDLISKKIYKD